MNYSIQVAGDSALLISFEQAIRPDINRQIKGLLDQLKAQGIDGILEVIPAFASCLVLYDPLRISYQALSQQLVDLLDSPLTSHDKAARIWDIPLVYGGEFGPDLERLAQQAGLTVEEVIRRHAGRDYLIYMLGFLPGFAYLGGLDEAIHSPRLATPRLAIPAGSVGIGGSQTGIYPVSSPGGWQLIGRTPVNCYDPNRPNPIVFEAGDYIRFRPISVETYQDIEAAVREGSYEFTLLKDEVIDLGN